MKRFVGMFALVLVVALAASASTEKIVWNFRSGNDGYSPGCSSLIGDGKGNLYGEASMGGTYTYGVVFMLSPTGKETILHEFGGQAVGDGARPRGRLAFDANGNLYGTTYSGGTNDTGTVYELSPKPGGGWTEKVIYTFSALGNEGFLPSAGMTIAPDGAMYSTAFGGGAFRVGVIFSLEKTSKGWKQKVIHSIKPSEGRNPTDGLMMDTAGNLYGAEPFGGSVDDGVVYRLSRTSQDWVYKVLHSFTGNGDGSGPTCVDLINDASGNIYGTTGGGGTNDTGTVWELVYSRTKQSYSKTILYEFGVKGSGDGFAPSGGLAMDSKGSLYSVTAGGPSEFGLGTFYRLTKQGKTWKETILHSFGVGNDGAVPSGNPYVDAKGRLYGLTPDGGTLSYGTVYRVTP